MKAEIKTFSNWANGQCYGYTIEYCDNEDLLWGVNDCMEEWLRVANDEETYKFLNDAEKFTWADVPFQGMDSCWGYIEEIADYEDMYVFKEALSQIE